MNRREIGKEVELKALKFLQAKGLCLIVQNYTCKMGEVDLIMQDKEDIVFVEVRSRNRLDYGSASDTINHTKQRKIVKTATLFLQKNGWLYKVYSRFDVVVLQFIDNEWQLEWIKNAFYGSGR
jgi:putative endonuclease